MKKYFLLATALPFLLFAASCGDKTKANNIPPSEVIPVKVIALSQDAGGGEIQLSGQFTTDDEVMLGFKTGGIINAVLVKEGDAVKQGQLLATLNLTEINAQVQQAQLGFEKAQRDYLRVTNLYKDSVATLEQFQNSKTALELAKQQLNAAQFNRAFSEIRAPKNGYVLRKMANEGQVVAPGTPVLQTNGAHAGNWILKVGAGDKEWSAVSLNDKAMVTMSGNDEKQCEGVVARKSEAVDPATGMFTIEIKLTGKEHAGIASGAFGRAMIATKTGEVATGTWAVPYDAILDGDGSTGYVFVTNDGRTAKRVKVVIADIGKEQVYITGGLEDAQQLIVSGSAYLADNSSINIIK
jgi:RND family efflux transporter MFP subunit